MKIVYVIPYFLPSRAFGGPVNFAFHIYQEMQKKGHELVVYTSNIGNYNKIQKKFNKDEIVAGIHIRRVKILAKFMSYYFTPTLFKELLSEKTDIVHCHGYRNFQVDCATLCSKLKKIPVVLHTHGMGISTAAKERGNKFGNFIYSFYDLATMRFALRAADKIIATSNFERKLLEEDISFIRGKIEVIPHGVDATYFQKNERLSEEFRKKYNINGKTLLYVGRVDKGKNIEAMLKAASGFKGINIVVVGSEFPSTSIGAASYKKEIKKLASKLKLNVIFTNGLYDEELIAAYSAADIFVNPSISKAENFGLVDLEAAACSLPVVAAPVGVAPDLLKEREWLLFNTEKELANILSRLLGDESLCRKTGEELKKKVEREYTWSMVAEKIERVYEKVAGGYNIESSPRYSSV